MSKSNAQPVTVTMDDDSQTVTIYPAAQVQQAQVVGLSMDGDDQTVVITPA